MGMLIQTAMIGGLCGAMLFSDINGCAYKAPSVSGAPGSALAASTAMGMWLIEWHTNGNALSYAVINGPSQGSAKGHVRTGAGSTGGTYADLAKPDGSHVSLLNSGRIYQISGTNVLEAKESIPAAVFEAFVKEQREDYSLPALVKFAAASK